MLTLKRGKCNYKCVDTVSKNMIAEVTDDDRTAHKQFLNNMKGLPDDAWKYLILVKEECIGCGLGNLENSGKYIDNVSE